MEKKFIVFANGAAAFMGTFKDCSDWAAKILLNQPKLSEVHIAEVTGSFRRKDIPVEFFPVPVTYTQEAVRKYSESKEFDVA